MIALNKIWILAFSFCLPVFCKSQSKADSLIYEALRINEDTSKVVLLTQAADLLIYSDPSKADSINQVTLAISEQHNFLKGIHLSLINLASVRIVEGDYQQANAYIDQVLVLAREHQLHEVEVNALNRRGIIQYYQGEFVEGIETNLSILKLLDHTSTDRNKLNALNNIGINYERLQELDQALKYYQQALDIADQLNVPYLTAAISANMGVIHKTEGRLDVAKDLFLQSIEIAEDINNQNLLVDELINLTDIYIQQEDFDRAKASQQRAQQVAEVINDQNGLIKINILEGKIYLGLEQPTRAINSFSAGLRIANEIGDKEELLNLYDFLHKSHTAAGKHREANQFLVEHGILKDSIFNLEKTNALSELETAYQVAQKDKEILTQELEIERKTRQRNVFLIVAGVLALVGLLTFLFLKRILGDQKKIAQQTQEIQQQQILQLEAEKKVNTLDAMVTGQEEERKRIAKDLHDSLGSLMATIKGHFNALPGELNQVSSLRNFKKTNLLIDNASEEVRRISHNMMPQALTDSGLIDAVQDLISSHATNNGWQIDMDVQGLNGRLEDTQELMVYRIIQELISNISKHALAKKVFVQLVQNQDQLHITVEDDGLGYYVKKSNEKGLGLSGIQSRVDYLKGEVEFDSVPGEGTTVSINIPLTNYK